MAVTGSWTLKIIRLFTFLIPDLTKINNCREHPYVITWWVRWMVKTAIQVNTQPTGLTAVRAETAKVHRRTAITTDWITTTMNTTWTWRRTEMINWRKMIRSQSPESGMLWRALRRLAKQDFCKNLHQQSSSWWFSCSLMFFKVDLFLVFIIFLLQHIQIPGCYFTYFVSVITTIEKLFHIKSASIALLLNFSEIGQIVTSLLLTYFAGRGHRPRWIACGMFLFSIAAFGSVSPHYIFGSRLYNHDVGATKQVRLGSADETSIPEIALNTSLCLTDEAFLNLTDFDPSEYLSWYV